MKKKLKKNISNYSNLLQVINYINERARRHWRLCFLSQEDKTLKTYSLTQDKLMKKKTSSEGLEGSQRLTQKIRCSETGQWSDEQGWASGQLRDEPAVRWSGMGQRSSTQDQIQGDQCEPEELEESEGKARQNCI